MPLGPWLRRALPPGAFRILGSAYRRVFVDLRKVAGALAPHLPPGALVLDIGGGDGALHNELLRLRPDLRVHMVDIAVNIGGFLAQEVRPLIELHGGVRVSEWVRSGRRYPVVLLIDVLHHVPDEQRAEFLQEVRQAFGPGGRLIVKDIAPAGWRASLSLWADRVISGDPGVSLLSAPALRALVEAAMPVSGAEETGLFREDAPNYAWVFHLG